MSTYKEKTIQFNSASISEWPRQIKSYIVGIFEWDNYKAHIYKGSCTKPENFVYM